MYYFVWFVVTLLACMLSVITGLWVDKQLKDDDAENNK